MVFCYIVHFVVHLTWRVIFWVPLKVGDTMKQKALSGYKPFTVHLTICPSSPALMGKASEQ